MKGLTKCSGLLLLLFITLGLSLSVSSDTNALQYTIDHIPFSNDTTEFGKLHDTYTNSDVFIKFDKSRQFSISIPTSQVPDGFSFPHVWEWNSLIGYSDKICDLRYYYDGVNFYQNSGVSVYSIKNLGTTFSAGTIYGVRSPLGDWHSISDLDSIPDDYQNALCNIYDYPYNDKDVSNPSAMSNLPRYDYSSLTNIPLVNNRVDYQKSLPYFYRFNSLYLNGENRDSNGDIVNSHGMLHSEDIFNVPVGNFNDMTISLSNMFSSANTDISCDYNDGVCEDVSKFYIIGSLNFWGPYSLGQYAGITMNISNYNDPNFSTEDFDNDYEVWNGEAVYEPTPSEISKSCTITETHSDNITPNDNKLTFICSYDPSIDGGYPIDFELMSIQIRFSGDPGSSIPWHISPFVNSSYEFSFQDFSIVTNANSTPAGWSSTSNTFGGTPESAPGNSAWDSSNIPGFDLTNLFNFTLLNPFGPLFGLFSDNSSCASIPTIANMLHAESSTYCPWFSQETRNILTPVIGFSATMLVFGFVIRWLSSSSGNFFEDSRHESISKTDSGWSRSKKGGK